MSNEIKHLITPAEFAELARPVSIHLDDNEVQAFINECEQMYIIPAVGYGNFKAAVTDTTWDSTIDDTFKPATVINGGEWTLTRGHACQCDTAEKELQYCVGLKTTLAYFVYAKMARADGAIYSRSGFMQHDDQYAHHVDDSKLKQYNDVMTIAETYLGDCMRYIKYHTVDKVIKPVHSTRARIHAIGE
jgi:hypothetical protein